MRSNKSILICALLVLAMMCIVGTASAADSVNETLTAQGTDDAIGVEEVQDSLSDTGTTIYVDGSYSGEEQGTQSNPYKNISTAVGVATGGETIFIKNGDYSVDAKISPAVSMSIVGETQDGVKITSDKQIGIFEMYSSGIALSFTNLTFMNINSGSKSSLILKVGGDQDVNVINCSFVNCKSKYGVMQIYTQATGNIENCRIEDFESTATGGTCGIYLSGEGTYNIRDTVIDNSKYLGDYYSYGVIYFTSKAGVANLENVTISNCYSNATSSSAGIIYSKSKMNIKNSRIINNTIKGGESSQGSLLYVNYNSNNNPNSEIVIEQSVISGNTANYTIYSNSDSAKTTINYTNIQNNVVDAVTTSAGTYNLDNNYWGTNSLPEGVVASSWIVEENGEYKLNNGDSLDVAVPGLNDVTEEPPASNIIYVAADGSDETGTGSESAPLKTIDKAIAQAGSEITTIFVKNGEYATSYGIDIPTSVNLRIVGEEKGKVIVRCTSGNYVFKAQESGCTLVFENLTFADVDSTSGSSAGLLIGGDNRVDVVNCTFANINAKFGAIQMASSNEINLKDCLIENVTGSTSGNGAIVYLSGSGSYNMDGIVINNVSMGDISGDYSFMRDVIYVYSSTATVTLTNSKITNAHGPMQAIIENKATMNIENVTIMNNTIGVTKANGQGTAILYNGVRAVKLTVSQCLIINNHFENENGAVLYEYSNANDFNIEYSAIYNNTGSSTLVSGTTANIVADYNYWGSNDEPVGVTVNNWVIEENGNYKLNNGSELEKEIPTLTEESEEPVVSDAVYVSTEGSDENDGSENSPVFNITRAVELAKAGSGNIIIREGTYSQNGITIDGPITIIGEGNVVIDGTALAKGNIFIIATTENVTIKNIKFKNINVRNGAINIEGNSKTDLLNINVLIEECEFDNVTANRGGAIYAYYTTGNLMIANSNFTNLQASGWGGAICAAQSAYGEGLNVDIAESTFADNRANNGGALYVQASTLTVTDSSFYKNSADSSPGAIYLTNITAFFDNCQIVNNTALKDASAIGVYAGQISTNPTVLRPSQLTITNSIIENNTGGAALYVVSSNLNISYSSVVNDLNINNTVTANYNGDEPETVTANNNWWGANDPTTTVDGEKIVIDKWVIMNIAANASEVLAGDSVKLTVDFNHVNTTSGEIEELTGGAIPKTFTVTFTSGSGSVEPASVDVAKGTSKDVIYAVADADAVVYAQTGDVINTLSFAKGVEPYYGVIYVSKDGDDNNNGSELYPVATLSKAVELALVSGGSGQIIINEGTYNGTDYRVTGNLTVTGVGNVVLDGENQGRLFYMAYGDNADKIELINLTIVNAKHNYGAAVYSLAKELVLDNVAIVNNNEIGTLIKSSGKLTIKDSVIENIASGTLIDISGNGDVLINNTLFTNITVDTAGTSNYGLIYANGKGTLTIENSNFTDNTVRQSVVICSADTNAVVKNSEFINNVMAGSVSNGGAISTNAKLNVTGSKFINNNACGHGGAIYIGWRGDATITKSVFINNTAGAEKHGNAISSGNKLTVTYSVITSDSNRDLIYHDGEYDAIAQYNWWGANDNPESFVTAGTYDDGWDDVDCVIDTSNWVIMKVASNMSSDSLGIGESVEFTVDFTHYIDSTNVERDLADSIPEVEVCANAVNGEMDLQKATTQNNVAKFTYTAAASGDDTITITSSNAVNETAISVREPVVIEVIYVSMSGDDNNNGSQSAPVATLKHAIEIAEKGKIIILNGEYTVTETLTIDKDLNIEGKGNVVLKGVSGTNMFINNVNLNLTGLQITAASSAAQSVLSDNGNTTISDCVFYGNTATGTGSGMINNVKGFMKIYDSKFYDNKAARGIISSQKETLLLINNSEFYDNDVTTLSASSKYGVLYLNSANAIIINSQFRNNKIQKGGAIYASIATSSGSTSVDIDNVSFIGNTALNGDGGAVFITGSNIALNVNINNSRFVENTASMSSGSVGGSGGAVYMASTGKLTIENSLFVNNAANNTYRGDAGIYASKGTVSVSNSVFITKENDDHFAINSDGATVTANDNFWGDNAKANTNADVARWVIMNATCTASDDGVLTITATFDKTNSTGGEIADYAVVLPDGFDVTFTSTSGKLNEVVAVKNGMASVNYTLDKTDSGITVKSANAEITFPFAVAPSIIYVSPDGDDSNNGDEGSPVATLAHAVEIAENGQIVLLQGTYKTGDLGIISNDLNITGEGKVIIDADNNNRILYVGEDAKVVLKNLIMIKGNGNDGSGALLGNSNYLTIINCTLANSSAAENNGGAIYNVGYLTIINSTISDNVAREGGAIFTNDALAKGATVTISNSVVKDNTATGSDNFGGGAIFAQQVAAVTIDNTTFENNKALGTSSGGAIFVSHSTGVIKVTDSQFIANHANGNEGVGGGAIYMTGTSNYERKGTLAISNSLFEDNTADSNGGAIYVRATTLNIANSALINNSDANNLTIYGYKTEQISPSITANDNWWGSNDDPVVLVGGNNYNPTISRWAILTLTNDTAIAAGNTVKLTASINTYTTGSETGTLATPIKVTRPVTITTTSGVVEGVLVDGEFSCDYTVPANLKIISATVDGQSEILYLVTTETVVTVDNITAAKGDSVNVVVRVETKDGSNVTKGSVELYFDDDLVATIPVVDGIAISEIMIGKDEGVYTITAKFNDTTEEFGYSEATATLNVTGINNIVTPETLSNFFDENGVLKSDVPFDELIFTGEFNDLGTLTIAKPIKITGDDALLNNTALKITADNVNVNNVELVADKIFDNNALIYIGGKGVVLEDNVIDYEAPNTGDSYAIYIDSADGLKLLNNSVTYVARLGEDIKTIGIYAIDANDMLIMDNLFDITVPSEDVGYGPAPDYAPTDLSGGLSFKYCDNLTLQKNDVYVDYNEFTGYYDTLKAVVISQSNDVSVMENDVVVGGHSYAYAIVADGKNMTISANAIESYSDDYYACAISIEKDSTVVVDNNNISASADDVSYGILADDWGTGSEVTLTNNNVSAESNTAYGMSVTGKTIDISNNNVTAEGNYTVAVGVKGNATIANNTILANASNVGNSTDAFPMVNPVESMGIYAENSEVSIVGNDVSSTGSKTVDLAYTNGTIKDNKLVANGTKGDASIAAANSTVVVDNNKTSEDPVVDPVIKLTGKSVSMYYGDKAKYQVRVLVDGKAVKGLKVKFTFRGTVKYVKTDAKGYATLTINNNKLIPKKYSISAQYAGKVVKHKVNVKQVLKASNVKVKKTAKSLVLKATLKKGKKAIKGKWITFKFNGKNYKAKTDKKGLAKVTIKKNVLNKLKAGKKYTLKVIYSKNTIKRTVTVRK